MAADDRSRRTGTGEAPAGSAAPAELGAAARARAIAAAVREVPGVAGLSSGAFGTTATPDAGGRVEGVAVREGEVEVGVVVLLDRPIPETAADVREAVHTAVRGGGGRVHVSVEDVAEAKAEAAPGGTATAAEGGGGDAG